MLSLSPRRLTPLTLALIICLQPSARAQAKEQAAQQQVFCDPPRAVALVRAQLSEAKAFTDTPKRIAVTTRAADLLWPYERQTARDAFAEAFDLASAYFREHGDEVRREQGRADSESSVVLRELPDPRFVVLRAVAKHDVAWARELAERAAQETREEADKTRQRDDARRRPVAEKLLDFAATLLETDERAAVAVARSTFSGPASMTLPDFLYKLAKVDRPAADALYMEALAAYSGRDVDSLLFLSAYPFARVKGIAFSWWMIDVPQGFAANEELQRQFVAALLRLSESRLAAYGQQPADAPPDGVPEPEKIYEAMRALETLYPLPPVPERAAALEAQAAALISPDRLRNVESVSSHAGTLTAVQLRNEGNFAAALEKIEDNPDGDERDRAIINLIMTVSDKVPAEKVEAAAEKIGDDETRRDVLDYFYFSRARDAASAGALDEARKLAEHVVPLDERAMLFLDIAEEGLKRGGDSVRARDLLDAVVAAAERAPETLAKARALVGVAYLYARFDYLRGLDALGEAVKTINKLKDPELNATEYEQKIQGKNMTYFMDQHAPGFSLENAARELGARDFELTVSAAGDLDDKYLRSTVVLAVAARCLEEAQKTQTRKPDKRTTAPKDSPATKKPDAPKKQP
jgi:hypothetical protein